MSVTLPTTPKPASATPRPLDWGGESEAALGGPTRRIERLGSRFAVDVALPDMLADVAIGWIADLLAAKRSSGILAFPQPGVEVGDEGTPRVNGGGQLGTSLAIDGLPAGKVIKKGWFLTIITNGRRYLYCITAPAVASGGGAVTLSLDPMIRRAPTDNAVIKLAVPEIEGAVQGSEAGWNVGLAAIYGISFTLAERE